MYFPIGLCRSSQRYLLKYPFSPVEVSAVDFLCVDIILT